MSKLCKEGGDDGGGEVPVAGFSPCTLAAIRPDGTLLWVSRGADFDCGGHAPALADLEGDGDVEIVLGALVTVWSTWQAIATWSVSPIDACIDNHAS